MINKKLVLVLLVILIITLIGCGKKSVSSYDSKPIAPVDREYRCQDGSFVKNIDECQDLVEVELSVNPEIQIEPKIEVVETPKVDYIVNSDQDAKSVFSDYVVNNDLDYVFLKSEFYKEENGIKYYKVTYNRPKEDVKSSLLVDSQGRINAEYMYG